MRLPSYVMVVALFSSPALARAAESPALKCEHAASDGLRACIRNVSRLQRACYRTSGQACAPDDAKIAGAHAAASKKVLGRCPDQATVTAAGYPPLLTPSGLDARIQSACTDAVATLAARSWGGPHAAVRNVAGTTDQKCLDGAYAAARTLIDYDTNRQSSCIRKTQAGDGCDTADVAEKLAAKGASTAARIAKKCPAALETLVAVDAATFASRAAAQSRCLVATAHGSTAPLALDCGPRAAVPVPAPGVPTHVVLDGATWGTRCGDGSDYAFWIRLAPTGSPLEKILLYLEGGGACYDGPGCAAAPDGRFEALSENFPGGGIFNTTNVANQFRNWTIVYLPYCTQDLHIGGGITDDFSEMTVHRYGAVNFRTAVRYVRDVVWGALDATDSDGYRGDLVQAVLSGSSAGGYGDAYNYHWVLDELRWPHTTMAPDAGLGMDNGGPDGVIALGSLALYPTSPGWAVGPYLPPYCFTPSCAEIFDNLERAHAARLLVEPEQQILNVSNQIDNVQRNTTNFPDTPTWTNTLRATYCGIQGTPGIHPFFSALSSSTHGQLNGSTYYTTTVGGRTLAQWLGDSVNVPASATDEIATGTLEADHPGVQPFPCAVSSPSGAFID